MTNILEYKGYYTQIKYNPEDKYYHGKIEGIRDPVNFGSEDVSAAENEFHLAVDDHISFCKEIGKNFPISAN